MSEETVESIAGESEENKRQRERLQKQLDVLDKGSDFCKRFVGLRIGGEVWMAPPRCILLFISQRSC